MIFLGLKIRIPNSKFIKKFKDYEGREYYSFIYHYRIKDEKTNQWETVERYIINISNIEIKPESHIICTKILQCKPQNVVAKNGKEYNNCVVFIEGENVKEDNSNNNKDDSQENYEYGDLGF